MKVTGITFWIGALAIAGIPPLAGFWSKDEILVSAYRAGHTEIWLLGVIGAAMTAFYMFRLIFMTFHGKPRDQHLHDHAHESPSSMTVPLIFLAAGSVVVGFVGVPPGHGWIDGFLSGVVGSHQAPAVAHGLPDWALMLVSVVVALIGISVAYLMFRSGKLGAGSSGTIHRVLENKWYVDEIYYVVIVRPIRRFSQGLWTVFDTIVVDGIVNGLGYFVQGVGWIVTRLQSGRAPTYALWMALGVVTMLYYTTAR
jgi:NADH-quinone oxidoreductase subunit L